MGAQFGCRGKIARILLIEEQLQWFEQTSFHAAKVRNVSRLGRQAAASNTLS